MDLKMKAESVSGDYPVWDVKVENGIVPIIHDDEEDLQTATLAAFLDKGTIPLLPDMGVPWTDFMGGNISFGDLDNDIRVAIRDAGQDTYEPVYSLENGRLVVGVRKSEDA
jgi:hypothetical protein